MNFTSSWNPTIMDVSRVRHIAYSMLLKCRHLQNNVTLGRCSAIYFGIMSYLCVVRMWKWNYFILYDLLISKYVIKYARSVFSPTMFRSAALLFQWLHLWGSMTHLVLINILNSEILPYFLFAKRSEIFSRHHSLRKM